jgi:hypothetical protein
MYKHAKGASATYLSRWDERVVAYPHIRRLGQSDKLDTLDCPDWLRQEIKEFTWQKWVKYWNPKTGMRNLPKKEKAGRRTLPSKKPKSPHILAPISSSRETKRPATLSLKKTEISTVKQSFSHGRTKAIVVEKKRTQAMPVSLGRKSKIQKESFKKN